jgi:hypothetical protein
MTGSRRWRAGPWAACLAAGWLAASCVSLERGGLYRTDRDEVFVAYFSNETFYRNVEYELSERLVAEILSSPGLRLTSKEDAEVLLSGRILDIQQRVLAEDPTRETLASEATIAIEVRLQDARTGQVLLKQTLRQTGQFVPPRGEELQFALREANGFLARDIVRLLEQDF